MTQTFNIKRFGLCLKYRLFDPMMTRYAAIALGAAIFTAIVMASTGNPNAPIGFTTGMIGGMTLFLSLTVVMNKHIETLLPAQPAEKFLSFAISSLLGAATLLAISGLAIVLTGRIVFGDSYAIPDKMQLPLTFLAIFAGMPIPALIGNLISVDSNVMPSLALLSMFVLVIPIVFHNNILMIILPVAGIALWIAAYAVYKRRQVKNG